MTNRNRALTARQEALLRFIIRYKVESGGDSPTLREMMRGVGITSTSVVAHNLTALEKRGLIARPEPANGRAHTLRRIVVAGLRVVYEPPEEAQRLTRGSLDSISRPSIRELPDDEPHATRGRPPILSDADVLAAHRQHMSGITLTALARHYEVHPATLSARMHKCGLTVVNFTARKNRIAAAKGENR